jgi:hypothetical protein
MESRGGGQAAVHSAAWLAPPKETYAVASCPFLLRGGAVAEKLVDDNMAVFLPWSQHNCTVAWGYKGAVQGLNLCKDEQLSPTSQIHCWTGSQAGKQ